MPPTRLDPTRATGNLPGWGLRSIAAWTAGHRLLLLCCLTLVVTVGLTACSTPAPAPVEIREEPSSQPSQTESTTIYRVQPGDSLYMIAWRLGLDYRVLAAWNQIPPPYVIHAGQELRLQPSESRLAAGRATAAARGAKKPTHRAGAIAKSVHKKPSRPKTLPREPVDDDSGEDSGGESPPGGTLSWLWPTQGRIIQTYVPNDRAHQGIKIAGSPGQAVVAAENGKVVYSGDGLIGYGRLIIIKHNKDYLSAYGLNKRVLVKEGDQVSRGMQIAEMGGPAGGGQSLLHFEIRKDGDPVDPARLLPKRG